MPDGNGKPAVHALCVTNVLLILTIAAQIATALFVMHATKIMDKEWPRVLKSHGETVMVVELHQFWGPVHVLVPTSCKTAILWNKTLEDLNEELFVPDEKTSVRLLDNATESVDHAAQKADSKEDAGEDQVPKTAAKKEKTKQAKDKPAEKSRKTQQGDDKMEEVDDDGEEDGKATFVVGQLVQRRDDGKDWGTGYIVSVDPLKVTVSEGKSDSTGYSWDEVRQIETEAADFHVGQKVQRENGHDDWGIGYVTSVDPLLVSSKDPDGKGLKWDQVRPLPKDAVAHVSKLRQLRKSSMPPPAEDRELLPFLPRFIPNVSICGKDGSHILKDFAGPTYVHRYFSMITLSQMITGGTDTMDKLVVSRLRTYRGIFVLLGVTMILKYSLKLIDIFSRSCGHKYVQLWNGGRTTMDRMIESLMIHGVSIVFTLAMQLTLCTLFLTLWEGEFFIMSYIPGLGFIIFFMSFVCFTICMVIDRVRQTMLNAPNSYIYCFWFWWVFWMFLVCIPMIGYSVYVLQFVIQAVDGHMLHTQPFSEEFIKASRHVCKCAGTFTGIALAELIIILKLDLEEGKTRTSW